jgi:Na+/H+-translocating membrane pyrophosphatase
MNTGLAFLAGAVCSILAGFLGMMSATSANVRTTEAARSSGQARALLVSFMGGSVMGLAVASLGLIGVGILFIFFGNYEHADVLSGFAMGASSIALFRPRRRRYLHQGRGCRRRSRRQGRGRHSRRRPPQSRRHRRQCRRQRG